MAFHRWFRPMLLVVGALLAGAGTASGQHGNAQMGLTGDLQTDLLYGAGVEERAEPEAARSVQALPVRRSVPLAGALSLAVPGAGQVYNRSWIKALALAGVEGAILTTYFSWRGRGRDGEEAFQQYAHLYWSPVRYAQWLSGYSGYGGEPIPLPDLSASEFMNPDQWSTSQRAAVDAFFRAIRAAESRSIHVETGASFSHVLPFFGEQQYYELIGKYFQYAPGWDDYNGADDPEESGPNGEKVNVPRDSRFFLYAADHADANTWFRRASRLSSLIVVNHFLAAIDAAVSAKLHNDRLRTRVALVPGPDGLEPVVGLSLGF